MLPLKWFAVGKKACSPLHPQPHFPLFFSPWWARALSAPLPTDGMKASIRECRSRAEREHSRQPYCLSRCAFSTYELFIEWNFKWVSIMLYCRSLPCLPWPTIIWITPLHLTLLAGEMAQLLRALAAFAEDLNAVPSTHTGLLIASYPRT